MKKQLLSLVAVGAMSGSLFAQLPVSTAPANKKVLLEEFTGIKCQYCPDGHYRADLLKNADPTNVYVINIHTNSYGTPSTGYTEDFRTPFGENIAAQTALTGFPAGTINRHHFANTVHQNTTNPAATAMSRGNWASQAAIIKGQPSYLNVALQGTLNSVTRELKVDVEVYYTGNSPQSVNYFNLALTQDSVMSDQHSGAATWYPAMIYNTDYINNKMLRHMLTGQWGVPINTTTSGFKFTGQYTYTVPAQLPLTVSGVGIKTNVLLSKLKVIGFVCQNSTGGNNTQEVISCNGGPITIVGASSDVYDASNEFDAALYPNPTAGDANLTLKLNKNQDVTVKMYNMLGTELYNYNANLNTGFHNIEIPTTGLANGIYFVKTFVGAQETTRKLTIDK